MQCNVNFQAKKNGRRTLKQKASRKTLVDLKKPHEQQNTQQQKTFLFSMEE